MRRERSPVRSDDAPSPRGYRKNPMAVPKRKHSNSRTGTRRAHDGKAPRQLARCSECNTWIPTHVVCPKCGHYMGRKIVET